MKKFLSLVLALVMTMSLVTISAGATEYKDFTDKDEIKYEEAVTVLNKLGIITGYSEGDFRPEGELTRGAAAKIIVSLLIGPEAAEALGNESSPYPDVPAGNNFAGVISFCKTSEIINGYGDGTFRPQGTLTGFAFAKMLLGALGYDGDVEGFSGAGWNMKVATLGHQAGLFDRITFNGNATVTREQACQLALNTLKATMVEYSGGMNITTSDGSTMVVNPNRDYKVSNQEFATHINNKKAGDKVDDNWYTVEFGEEHFVDLRMSKQETTAHDAFGRPSNEWSYKKVTIGTFPIEPDYVFTSQVARRDATDAAKNRATGLGSFKLTTEGDTTDIWTNGRLNDASDVVASITKVAQIADLTDNGTVVEVYIDDDAADFISDIVVIKSQLMEVRNVGSDYVSFQREDNKAIDEPSAAAIAYNQKPIDKTVENIQSEDDLYSVVSGLKAGDLVVVTPVAQDETGTTKYDVGDVYVPETVSGAITAVDTYGTNGQTAKDAVSVTVGGTKYSIALWARDLFDVDAEKVKITRKDVTLYLDRYGYAMKANDIGDTSDWFIIGRFYQTLVNNRIVTMAEGWDISGTEMTLNLGTANNVASGYYAGDLVRYTTSTSNNADWSISDAQTTLVGRDNEIKASDVYIPLVGEANDVVKTNTSVYVDKGIKFIYVNYDRDTDEVTSIEIRNGVQGAKITELEKDFGNGGKKAQAGYSVKDGAVEAVKVVVIKNESTDALSSNMLYIEVADGAGIKDENGNMIYKYTVAMMSPNSNRVEEKEIYSSKKLAANTFASYSAVENANYSEFYDLRAHNNYTETSVSTFEVTMGGMPTTNKYLMYVVADSYDHVKGTSEGMWTADHTPMVSRDPRNASLGEKDTINFQGAVVVDLRTKSQRDAWTGYTDRIETADELYNFVKNAMDTKNSDMLLTTGEKTFELQLIINDNDTSNGFRHVDMIVITDEVSGSYTAPASTSTGLTLDSSVGTWTDGVLNITAAQAASATVTLTASAGAAMSVKVTDPVASGSLASAADNTWTSTAPLTAGKATIVVTAEDGTTKAEYPLEIVIDDGVYRNTYALDKFEELGFTDGTEYNSGNWTDDGNDNVVAFDAATMKLTAPVLLTGAEGEVEKQLTAALEWLSKKTGDSYTNLYVKRNGECEFDVNGNDRERATWTPSDAGNAQVVVGVDGGADVTYSVEVATAKVGTDLKVTGNAKMVSGTTTSVVANTALNSTVVTPGAVYTSDAFVEITAISPVNGADTAAGANGAVVTVTSDLADLLVKDAAGKTYLEVGKTVTITATLKTVATTTNDTMTVETTTDDQWTITGASTTIVAGTDTVGKTYTATLEAKAYAAAGTPTAAQTITVSIAS